MLKLYLRTHGPSMAEVIAEVESDVWQVEASVAIVILVCGRVAVAVEMLTVEIPAHHGLAISTDTES